MGGIVLEDNCRLLSWIPVSFLRQPLLRGGRSPRKNSPRIELAKLIELTRERLKSAHRALEQKGPYWQRANELAYGKSGSNGQEKSEEERDFHWMQGISALDQEKSAMAR